MNDLPPSPSRLLKLADLSARWLLRLVLAGWLVVALAWGALHGWIVPRIGEFRPAMEEEAARILGVPVKIGSVTAQSLGAIPTFELRDVALLGPGGAEALRLPRVTASLSPASIWNLGFSRLAIEQPVLDIRRDRAGKLFVAGLDLSQGGSDGAAADWFFSQPEFVIRGGTIRWTDELRAAEPLTLTRVDFVMRNSARRHAMRVDATPPAEWGERFSLNGVFRQRLLSRRAGQWSEWDGQVHGDFPRVDLSLLRRHADLGIDVSEGRGALRAWADVSRGRLTGGTADVSLETVVARLGAGLEPLALEAVAGRVGGAEVERGFEFSTEGLQFRTSEGVAWPGGNVLVTYAEAGGDVPARGRIKADRLDLAALAQIAQRLPLGTATHALVAAHAPRGLVETLQGGWEGPVGALRKFDAKGRVTGFAMASAGAGQPTSGIPGIRGADVDFQMTQAGGRAKLAIAGGALEFPGVFEDPVLPFDKLSADAQWDIAGDRINARVTGLKFSNADAEGEAHASWQTSDPAQVAHRSRFPGILDLQGTLGRADGARVWRYLPSTLPKPVRDYVRDAVSQGSAGGAKFRVKGDLHDFPYGDPRSKGEFHIATRLSNTSYAFAPKSVVRDGVPWPALTQLSGELIFDRASMQVKDATARATGAPNVVFTNVDAVIPDLAHSSTVILTAQAKGPVSEVLGIVNNSPLARMTGDALRNATATGSADYRLKLTLPINTIERSKVQGSVTLAGNDIQMSAETPMLSRVRGVVTFSDAGFAIAGGQARAMGGELRLEGGTRSVPGTTETAVLLRAQGNLTAEGLRQAKELGFVSRLAQNATGGATYAAAIGFRRGVPEISITSSLQGLGLNLPAPLEKAPEATMPLRYENTLVRESLASGRLHDQLLVDLGRVASIAYVRDLSGREPRVVRGGIGIGLAQGESLLIPEEGVAANINLAAVNLDAWEKVLEGAAGTGVGAAPATPPAAARPPGTAAAAAAANPALGYLPTTMAVRARDLTVEGRTLHNVVVGGSRDGLQWRANVNADELNGYVEYRQPAGAGGGRLYARLARLRIAPGSATDVEALLDEQPESIPALDVVVDDLELRGKRFGRVEIDAVNRGASAVAREGGVREWRLNKLNVYMPEATFTASGNWASLSAQPLPPGQRPPPRAPGERRRTVMNFRLDINDSGELLGRIGMKDVIRRGKGRLEGQVAWLGSPLTLDYPTLNGQVNVNVESGQFLKADPGLAKLLGVLSLQSLPRRLTLDFRDVFSAGFAFDFVRGDLAIANGIASTNNLQMKGVNAAVLMEGRADIARETQDLKVVVIPELNAGTASLVAAAINPAIGLGTFLAQMFLRRPLIEAATQEFHIDGTWTDPKITKVEKKPAPARGASPAPGANPTQ